MLEKLKKWVLDISIKDAEINEIKDEISHNNRRSVMVLCPSFTAVILFLLVLGNYFDIGASWNEVPVLITGLIYCVAIMLLVIFTKKDNYVATNIATYSTIVCALSCGIMLSYHSPSHHTVGFIVIVGALAMTFLGRPRIIGGVIFAGTVVCIGTVYFHKIPEIRHLDMINIIAFTLLFSVCGLFSVNAKLKGYLVQHRISSISDHDVLTGLQNRNSYERFLRSYVLPANSHFGCVFIDANGLHEINDKKGHDAGDEMLRFIASVLKSQFGKDEIYRIGGDEFVVLSTSLSKEELHEKMLSVKIKLAERAYHIAIGIDYGAGEFSASETIKNAELKMRDNKNEFYLENSLTYLRRRNFVTEADADDSALETDNKLLIYRYILETMNKNTNDYLFVLDIKRGINWFFGAINEHYPLRADDAVSNTIAQMLNIVHPDDRAALSADLERVARGEQDGHNMSYRWVTRSGDTVWVNCRGTVVKDSDGTPSLMFGRVSEAALRHLYYRQNGFWNRQKLIEDLNEKTYWNKHNALMLFEIDSLAEINIAHGRHHGDAIVKNLGAILASHPAVIQFYLIEYNRFAAVIKTATKEEANAVYNDVRTKGSGSFGVFASVAPIDHKVFFEGKDLLDATKVMLQKAGSDSTRRFYAFDDAALRSSIDKISLYEEMKESIADYFNGFSLVYQPKFQGGSLEICGVEVLLRYTSKSKDKLSPDSFIPVLEHTGLIKYVGMWVLENALRQCKKWRESLPSLSVSVNFSTVQFSDEDLVERVSEILHKTDMPADSLIIEITESRELFENPHFNDNITGLRSRGIKLSIDDFGTGYSNFDYLRKLDIDEIKVDRVFIKDIEKGSYNYSLLSNLLAFAEANGIRVCCEGVETEKELSVIKNLHPDSYQGYLFCRPYTAKTIELNYIDQKSKKSKSKEGYDDSLITKL